MNRNATKLGVRIDMRWVLCKFYNQNDLTATMPFSVTSLKQHVWA